MLESNFKDALDHVSYASDHMETMGQRIRRLRDQRDLSQGELGDLVGVTGASVSQWERDETENIKLAHFLRLAKVLGTDPQYLVFGPGRGAAELSKPIPSTPSKRAPRA